MQPLSNTMQPGPVDPNQIPKPTSECSECGAPLDYERNPDYQSNNVVNLPAFLVQRSVWREIPHPACQAKQLERERAQRDERRLAEFNAMLRQSGFPGEIHEKTLASFRVDPENSKAVELVRRWRPSDRFGFWFQGPPGSGKSHLMGSFVHRYYAAARDQVPSMIWWSVPFLFDRMQKDFSRDDGAEPIFNQVLKAEVLFLDDLGAQQGKPWETERLFQIFDHRINWKLPTFVTTNLTSDEVKASMHERVSSRLIGLCMPVVLVGRDRRNEILAQRRRELMKRSPV